MTFTHTFFRLHRHFGRQVSRDSLNSQRILSLQTSPGYLFRCKMSSSPKAGDKRELSSQPPTDDHDLFEKKPRLDDAPTTSDLKQAASAQKPPPTDGPSNLKGKPKTITSNKKPVLSKRQKRKQLYIEPCSHDDVYWQEIIGLIGQENVDAAVDASLERESPFGFKEEVEVTIARLSSNGACRFLFFYSPEHLIIFNRRRSSPD